MTFRSLFKLHCRLQSAHQIGLFGLLCEVKDWCTSALPALAFAWILAPVVFSASIDSLRYRPGLRNSSGSHQLSAQQLQMVVDSLRRKSGFLELRFDESSFLILGDRTHIAGGSAAARELLIATIDGSKVFELENHNHSPYIAFGRLGGGIVYQWWPIKVEIAAQQVQLDFSDFAKLRGNREVLAAFDIGLVVLHELSHVLLSLHDAVTEMIQIGACDEHINRMRRELGLPERQHYYPRLQLIPTTSGQKSTIRAEILFVRAGNGPGRAGTKRFYLRWDAEMVSSVGITSPNKESQNQILVPGLR